MSTHVQGFSHFPRFFASFCIGQISHQQQNKVYARVIAYLYFLFQAATLTWTFCVSRATGFSAISYGTPPSLRSMVLVRTFSPTRRHRYAHRSTPQSQALCTHQPYRQLCLIRTDVDPKFLSGLGKIRIMCIVIICIGRDWELPSCPV